MINLAILFGGISSEHEISCKSAAMILETANPAKYRLFPIGITKDGRWFLYENPDIEKIRSDQWKGEPSLTPACISPDRGVHGLIALRESGAESIRLDCAFPVLHGIGGEDGTMQGLLTLAGIPFVGPGVAASANSMDKSLTKVVVGQTGVRQAAYYLAQRSAFRRDPERVVHDAMQTLPQWPVFVKPCSSGSSVGITRATDAVSLKEGLAEAFRWDPKVLVEEFIDGHEIEVAVLGNDEPVASVAGEIAPTQEFYSYDAKYNDATSALYIPAHIPADAMHTVRENALRVYQALGCQGLARVDFFCTYDGDEIVFNEINTIPGFTNISMYPKLFEHAGIPNGALVDRLVEYAMEAER